VYKKSKKLKSGEKYMDDTNEMTVSTFEVGGKLAGICIDPKSDVETVYIQSPPSFGETKINPRSVVILFSAEVISERDVRIKALKAIADKKKIFVVCPASFEENMLIESVEWLRSNAKVLNIVAKDIRAGYVTGSANAAKVFREMASDEFGIEFIDAGEFDI